MEWLYMLVGFLIGVGVTAGYTAFRLQGKSVGYTRHISALALAFVLVSLLSVASPTLAQTPVPLEIPTSVIFEETNNWLATFAPIAAIGIGIAIALAVLGYLGKMITSAFKG